MPADPDLYRDQCYFYVPALQMSITKPDTPTPYEVPKGNSIKAHYYILNSDIAGTGEVGIQIWDYRNNRGLLWESFTMKPGETKKGFFANSFTADKDMELAFILYYKDEAGNWVQKETYGCEDKELHAVEVEVRKP